MGMMAPPIYILAVVVLAFGGIPKGVFHVLPVPDIRC
jgi:hypothetical protein